jgi:hypothetical protein
MVRIGIVERITPANAADRRKARMMVARIVQVCWTIIPMFKAVAIRTSSVELKVRVN